MEIVMASKFVFHKRVIDKLKIKLANNIDEVGLFVENEAKKNLTADGLVKSGKLKESITHITDKKELSTRIGTDVEYAPFLELGTIDIKPHAFLRNAVNLNKVKIKRIIEK